MNIKALNYAYLCYNHPRELFTYDLYDVFVSFAAQNETGQTERRALLAPPPPYALECTLRK